MKSISRMRWIFMTYFWALFTVALIIGFDLFSPTKKVLDSFILGLFPHLYLTPVRAELRIELLISLILFLLPGLYFRFPKLQFTADALFITIAVSLTGIGIALYGFDILISPLYLLLSFIAGTFVAAVMRLIVSSQEQEFLRHAFSQYVSHEILRDLLRHPEKLSLQGKEYPVTVLFLDIRGFTAYSEKHNAQLVVARLNELLGIVTKIIISHRGTVDKYMGDSVLAFWGAPNTDARQAQHAIVTAREVKKEIETKTEFSVGIGINYGTVIVGNIGSIQKFDYTAIGDTVNTAARLQGATKELGHTILISQTVVAKCEEENFPCKSDFLGNFRLRGRQQPIKVFALRD